MSLDLVLIQNEKCEFKVNLHNGKLIDCNEQTIIALEFLNILVKNINKV